MTHQTCHIYLVSTHHFQYVRLVYLFTWLHEKIKKLLEEVKDREFIGYSYDGADASFELLARRIMGEIPRYISI